MLALADFALSDTDLILIFFVTVLTKGYGVIIGGASFILQPFLIAMGVPPHLAVSHDVAGTNGTTVSGLWVFSGSGHIRSDIFRHTLPGLLVGPLFGVWLLASVSEDLVKNMVTVISCLGLLNLLLKSNRTEGIIEQPLPTRWKRTSVMLGFGIGTYMGFSAAGGGVISSLVLISALKRTMTETVATRRVIHAVPFLISTVGYWYLDWLNLQLFLSIFFGSVVGGYLGCHLTLKMSDSLIKYAFLGAALFMALINLSM